MRLLLLLIGASFVALAYGDPTSGGDKSLVSTNSKEKGRQGPVKRQICQWWQTYRYTCGWQCVDNNSGGAPDSNFFGASAPGSGFGGSASGGGQGSGGGGGAPGAYSPRGRQGG